MPEKQSSHSKWLLLILLSILWGSSFILMKMGMKAFSPHQVAALRIAVAFFVMIPVLMYNGLKEFTLKDLPAVFLIGIIGNTIPPFLFCFAQVGISSALAGILNALTPLFVLIMGVLFFSFQSNWNKNLGIGLGLVGTVLLILLKSDGSVNFQLNIYPFYVRHFFARFLGQVLPKILVQRLDLSV
jgi:drug/metabolite transporter (DMT)-like permease